MVRSVAGDLPEQVKNNQSVNTAAGNGGQKMSQYSWFTVYVLSIHEDIIYRKLYVFKGVFSMNKKISIKTSKKRQ